MQLCRRRLLRTSARDRAHSRFRQTADSRPGVSGRRPESRSRPIHESAMDENYGNHTFFDNCHTTRLQTPARSHHASSAGADPERIGRSLNDQAASNATSDLCVARRHFPSVARPRMADFRPPRIYGPRTNARAASCRRKRSSRRAQAYDRAPLESPQAPRRLSCRSYHPLSRRCSNQEAGCHSASRR
jgi:hypothetical protein